MCFSFCRLHIKMLRLNRSNDCLRGGWLPPPQQVHEGLDEAAEHREGERSRKQLTQVNVPGQPTSQWHRQHHRQVVQHHHHLQTHWTWRPEVCVDRDMNNSQEYILYNSCSFTCMTRTVTKAFFLAGSTSCLLPSPGPGWRRTWMNSYYVSICSFQVFIFIY